MPDGGADQVEVEWQFAAADTQAVARWLEGANIPGYEVAPDRVKSLDDTYYDTDDWRVHAARFTCRTRRKGDALELTLKAFADAVDGIRSRRELTEPVEATAVPALAACPGPCGEVLRAVAGRRALHALFTVHTDRRTFALSDSRGELAEIALDDTSIPIGAEDHPARLARVEVEVEPGGVDRARRFVDVLVAAAGLTPVATSKVESGLIATGQHPPPAPTFGPTSVAAELTTGEVAFAVLRRHFGVFLANEAGTRLGHDIEALHDMRVAARRLRAAMAAFRPYLPPAMERRRVQLGWVAAGLGAVRDLDVQLQQLAEWREGFPTERAHALDAIETLFARRRETARARMLRVLDSRRYGGFVRRFAGALLRGSPRRLVPGRAPILATAPDLLERRYQRLRKQGDPISRRSPPEAYHALRIEAKRLRYCLEFVGPIYGRPAVRFSERLTALQDVLGQHQDADVAVAVLHGLANTARHRLTPETLLLMGGIAERYAVKAAGLRRQFPGVYAALRGQEWKALQRAVESRRSR